MHGRWQTTPEEYVEAVERYSDEIGGLRWAAPMDWMAEPFMVEKTGLSIREHQERTVENFLELHGRGPFIPVLQGWGAEDYLRCVTLYEEAGVALEKEPVVGVGSVCRRQDTAQLTAVLSELRDFNLHGFGVKLTGLATAADQLVSADSMAWSYNARKNPPLPGCTHASCANCIRWAMRWRQRVLEVIEQNRDVPLAEK